ncbi:MAG: hypothetical protein QNJ33_13410 [Crocosphaera sp.]|nr:hypothetical protein [Crocosphaera sp.]
MTSLQNRQLNPLPPITWEKLPDDFELPDQPVENNLQPLLASALRESLELAGLILESMLIASNFGLCATVGDNTIVKAPDWVYVPSVHSLATGEVRRSYTPHLEGDIPSIVMEFVSETEGGEYSINPLVAGKYEQQLGDENNRYWLEEINLFLGVWSGKKAEMTASWLRWWDHSGNLLLWGSELLEQERQRANQAELKLEQEQILRQKLLRLGRQNLSISAKIL